MAMSASKIYLRLPEWAVSVAGHRITLAGAVAFAVIWCAAGSLLGMPTRWLLLTNMFGTMTALFMLLIMQHSQNRDMHALQVKADELIRASNARNHLIGAERLEIENLEKLIRDRQAD